MSNPNRVTLTYHGYEWYCPDCGVYQSTAFAVAEVRCEACKRVYVVAQVEAADSIADQIKGVLP